MTLNSKQLQAELDKLLTAHDICDMFGITSMTLYTWRKERALPTLTISGGPRDKMRASIRFHPDDIAVWARTQGLQAKALAAKGRRVRLAA